MGVSVLFLYPLRHDPVRIPAATLVKPSRAACGVSSRTRRPGPDPPPPSSTPPARALAPDPAGSCDECFILPRKKR